ncbi:MAG TPA: TetR/AcrR family transcriptional regulator, partial [Acidimicrobiales bacterium]
LMEDGLRVAGLSADMAGQLLKGLPDEPSPALDSYLDAATRCIVRHGIERTTVQDVAADMGLNRGTIYRQVGNMQEQIKLLAARDIRRHLVSLPARVGGLSGPQLVVELAAIGVEDARGHPILAKILADEPGLVGNILEKHIGKVRDQVVPVLASLFESGMAVGQLARRDPTILASWIVRIVVTLVVLEPEAELRTYLNELLLPALTP